MTMRQIILLLSFFQAVTALQNDVGGHLFHRLLDPKGSVVLEWFYDYSVEEITFELQVRTTGWVGFGLNNHEKLKGTDMVIGGVFPNQTTYFSDRHIEEEWPPVIDKEQNYHLLSLTEDGTTTTMTFRRKFRTCDSYDINITNDTLRVSAAYGLDDTLQYNEEYRFVKSICLMEIVHNVVMPKTYHTFDIKLTDFHVPVEDTTYACTFIQMPTVQEKHHLFMYEQHVDSSLVHHILIYACANNTQITTDVGDCYGGDPTFSQCNQVIFGWAVGGSPFTLPPETGIPLGTPLDPYYVRIEVHFSNFDGLEGIVDNSGIKIYYTSELREHDAGILQFGVFTFPIHFIPPGAKAYRTYGLCHSDQFHEVNDAHVEDMHVISYLNHGHLTVRGIRVLHYRNGTFLGPLGDDNGYDFRLQEIRHHKEILMVKVGDVIIVECTQNTEDRDTVTFGGPSTLNEMCLTFLFYYPRTNISKCWAFTDIVHVINELDLEPTTDVMEAIGTLYEVEWDEDLTKKAEKAAKEALQTVIIESRQGIVRNTTAYLPEIPETKLGPCDARTYNNLDKPKTDKSVPAKPANSKVPNKSATAKPVPDVPFESVPAESVSSKPSTVKPSTAKADQHNTDKLKTTKPGSERQNASSTTKTAQRPPSKSVTPSPASSRQPKTSAAIKADQHLPDRVTSSPPARVTSSPPARVTSSPPASTRHPQTSSSNKAEQPKPVDNMTPSIGRPPHQQDSNKEDQHIPNKSVIRDPAGSILPPGLHEVSAPEEDSDYEEDQRDSHSRDPTSYQHSHGSSESYEEEEEEGPVWSERDDWLPELDAYDYHPE